MDKLTKFDQDHYQQLMDAYESTLSIDIDFPSFYERFPNDILIKFKEEKKIWNQIMKLPVLHCINNGLHQFIAPAFMIDSEDSVSENAEEMLIKQIILQISKSTQTNRN